MQLIFEKGARGRRGSTLPTLDVPGEGASSIPAHLRRAEPAALPEVTELEAIRHYVDLSRMNFGIETNFYPLGSCTMKYNPRFHEDVAALPGFSELHPLLAQFKHGSRLVQGALTVIYECGRLLSDILGFAEFTFQPLAGAHGELTGLMLIAAYHRARNDTRRRFILVPDAAHGTNPASCTLAGFETRLVRSDEDGNVDLRFLEKALGDDVAGLMLTCPNTLGLYDPNVRTVNDMVHRAGGLVYADGANLNAIVGRVRPGDLGFDVLHVNLHKTFSTPHGGGGPGAGPVGVAEKLVPYLPVSRVVKRDDDTLALRYDYDESIGYIAPLYGNFGVIVRAYAYILTLGRDGLRRVSEHAVIHANYVRVRLQEYYAPGVDRVCLHECVLSAKRLKERYGVSALDVAKALIDRGFHPPTMY